ncbi:hypothetical protein [Mycobacterium sp.]|uniref:hypothetical protein n=1 Tax=Mycobacterium sp. TaxID=1785 RepID=UPI003BAFDE58
MTANARTTPPGRAPQVLTEYDDAQQHRHHRLADQHDRHRRLQGTDHPEQHGHGGGQQRGAGSPDCSAGDQDADDHPLGPNWPAPLSRRAPADGSGPRAAAPPEQTR